MKNKIIDNAITLFSEKGYYGTTLDDIAKSVNIKKASLYYHYDNKEEIYRKSVENCFNYFKTFILESNNDSNYSIDGLYQFLFEFIFDINERYIRFSKFDTPFFRELVSESVLFTKIRGYWRK